MFAADRRHETALMSRWISIVRAPLDGTVVLGICDGDGDEYAYPMCWVRDHGWCDPNLNGIFFPTHWMPHPLTPSGRTPMLGPNRV